MQHHDAVQGEAAKQDSLLLRQHHALAAHLPTQDQQGAVPWMHGDDPRLSHQEAVTRALPLRQRGRHQVNIPADLQMPVNPIFSECDILNICKGCNRTSLVCDEQEEPCEGCSCSWYSMIYEPRFEDRECC